MLVGRLERDRYAICSQRSSIIRKRRVVSSLNCVRIDGGHRMKVFALRVALQPRGHAIRRTLRPVSIVHGRSRWLVLNLPAARLAA